MKIEDATRLAEAILDELTGSVTTKVNGRADSHAVSALLSRRSGVLSVAEASEIRLGLICALMRAKAAQDAVGIADSVIMRFLASRE